MKKLALTPIVLLGLAACVKVPTDHTAQVEMVPLHAVITSDNRCTVQALGKTFVSVGQLQGAQLPAFTGTLKNDGYHSITCWVGNTDGSDGNIIVTFSGNSYQQPFPTGTFRPLFEPPWGVTDKYAGVLFMSSMLKAEQLRTIDESTGSITVETTASGTTVTVDVTAMRYQI
jgi:hypothetical protein